MVCKKIHTTKKGGVYMRIYVISWMNQMSRKCQTNGPLMFGCRTY